MPRGCALLLASLLLAAALSATRGLGSPVKEKRGWTLNSAGYLLGPHAIDNHRSFHDKHGFTGKRELEPEDEARPGSVDRRLLENNVVRTIVEFLTFLQLKGDIDFQCPNRNYTFLESDCFKCMLSTRVKCDTCLILGLLL
ncbi:galanin peptides isoform X1 [Phocoena sinus]|uniref:galanin peptides isoform X1 n=1 Tax=Phocoena sinus TaxID=42100 RepID=UPI0013C4375D|nr:galanin peptides isoform X1 [Phocoena sinus]